MPYLCLQPQSSNRQLVTSQVNQVTDCSGYIVQHASEYGLNALTYPEANQLIGAVGLLFALVFIFRALRKLLGF